MGKAKRKPRPSMPDWYWLGQDGCWFCQNPNNCNSCKTNRKFVKEYGEKKIKGRTARSKNCRRKEIVWDE